MGVIVTPMVVNKLGDESTPYQSRCDIILEYQQNLAMIKMIDKATRYFESITQKFQHPNRQDVVKIIT